MRRPHRRAAPDADKSLPPGGGSRARRVGRARSVSANRNEVSAREVGGWASASPRIASKISRPSAILEEGLAEEPGGSRSDQLAYSPISSGRTQIVPVPPSGSGVQRQRASKISSPSAIFETRPSGRAWRPESIAVGEIGWDAHGGVLPDREGRWPSRRSSSTPTGQPRRLRRLLLRAALEVAEHHRHAVASGEPGDLLVEGPPPIRRPSRPAPRRGPPRPARPPAARAAAAGRGRPGGGTRCGRPT